MLFLPSAKCMCRTGPVLLLMSILLHMFMSIHTGKARMGGTAIGGVQLSEATCSPSSRGLACILSHRRFCCCPARHMRSRTESSLSSLSSLFSLFSPFSVFSMYDGPRLTTQLLRSSFFFLFLLSCPSPLLPSHMKQAVRHKASN